MPDIEGVLLASLPSFYDERGSVRRVAREMARGSEVYFSTVLPSVLKGWHLHKRMTLSYVAAHGPILVGLIDGRRKSTTYMVSEIVRLDDHENYQMLTIPPGVWNAFRCDYAYFMPVTILNVASVIHDPKEIVRRHPNDLGGIFATLLPFGRAG